MAVSFGNGEYFAKSFAPVSAFPFSVSWCGRSPTGNVVGGVSWFNMLTSGAGYLVQMDGSEVQAVFDVETYQSPLNPDLTGDSNWHWFTAVFTATRTYWYADGALITDFAHTQAIETILALEVGGDSQGFANGPIDMYDFRIHTSQWGLTEHQAFYNSGAGDGAVSVDVANIHLHYKLLDATDPTPEDVSGTHALTLSAGAVDDVANPYAFTSNTEVTPSPVTFSMNVPAPYSTHIVKNTSVYVNDPLRAVGMRRTI